MTAIFKAEGGSAVIDGRGQIFVLQEPNVAAALPGPPGPDGPPGPGGPAATVTVGATTTGAPGSSASVSNAGTSSAAVLDFTIPRGATGTAATIEVGTVTTGAAGSAASITNAGTSSAAVLDFTIPRGATGATGDQGPAATIAVGTVTTGAPGSPATVTNVGTAGAAEFNFSIPRGADGTGSGTVTSVDLSGGTTGFGFTGGPITSTGTLTLTVTDQAIARAALGLGSIATLAAPGGDVVGTSGAQTLASKTLSAPVIDGYTEGSATASGTAFAPNLAADTLFHYTTTASATITLPAPAVGKSFTIVVNYGGAHTLTWAGGARKWPGGAAPAPTSVSGKVDVFTFVCVDGSNWLAFQSGANL